MKSRLLRNRDCHAVVSWMLHNWAVKCITLLGADPGPGGVEAGREIRKGEKRSTVETSNRDESNWEDVWVGKLDKFTATGKAPRVEAKIEESARAFELSRVRLIRLADAERVAEEAAKGCITRWELDVRRGGRMTWRKWQTLQGGKRIMEAELAVAKENLVFALLKRRRRVGVQYLSTRRPKRTIPTRSFFQFSGRAAWYQGRGRPALPEAEWLRRYNARKRRRQRANKTSRTLNRGPVKVPRVRGGRPRLNLDLNASKLRSFV